MFIRLRQLLRRGRGQEGAVAVEFALCLLPLVLILGGIIDFGTAWYTSSILSMASREGARYATRYQAVSGTRVLPSSFPTSVSSQLTTNYASLLPSDANLTVTPSGPGWTETDIAKLTGKNISVQVTAQYHWLFLANLIPGLTNPQTLHSTTTMSCE